MPTSSLTRVMFLQVVQDAANKARSDEMSCDRRESLESLMKTSEEPAAAARQQAERQRREPSRLRVPAPEPGARPRRGGGVCRAGEAVAAWRAKRQFRRRAQEAQGAVLRVEEGLQGPLAQGKD
jgi:hypothetical protein